VGASASWRSSALAVRSSRLSSSSTPPRAEKRSTINNTNHAETRFKDCGRAGAVDACGNLALRQAADRVVIAERVADSARDVEELLIVDYRASVNRYGCRHRCQSSHERRSLAPLETEVELIVVHTALSHILEADGTERDSVTSRSTPDRLAPACPREACELQPSSCLATNRVSARRYATAMLATINSTVGYELTRYPRATRGSAQNLFRAAYQMLRASSLGRKEPWSGSASNCAMQATMIVGQNHPGFVPVAISDSAAALRREGLKRTLNS
jgi:hypothetical protein